jgi:hypothetical protein
MKRQLISFKDIFQLMKCLKILIGERSGYTRYKFYNHNKMLIIKI